MTFWRNILLILCLSGLVAACGVNGRPELPPGIDKNQNTDEDKTVLDQLI